MQENPQILLQRRMQHAQQNSWKVRVQELEEIIAEYALKAKN
jgi:hypothetical protein